MAALRPPGGPAESLARAVTESARCARPGRGRAGPGLAGPGRADCKISAFGARRGDPILKSLKSDPWPPGKPRPQIFSPEEINIDRPETGPGDPICGPFIVNRPKTIGFKGKLIRLRGPPRADGGSPPPWVTRRKPRACRDWKRALVRAQAWPGRGRAGPGLAGPGRADCKNSAFGAHRGDPILKSLKSDPWPPGKPRPQIFSLEEINIDRPETGPG